jgi:hypothetical protein
MFNDTSTDSHPTVERLVQCEREQDASRFNRRPAGSWNFLAWSFFIAQMLTSSAAQAAIDQLMSGDESEPGQNANAQGMSASPATNGGARAGVTPSEDESPAQTDGTESSSPSEKMAEIGGMEATAPADAGQVGAMTEGGVMGGVQAAGRSPASPNSDGSVQVIGVIIEIPGGTTGQPGVTGEVGSIVDVAVGVDAGNGITTDVSLGNLVDVAFDAGLVSGIETELDMSIGDLIETAIDISLFDGLDANLDVGVADIVDIALQIGLDQGLHSEIGVSLAGVIGTGFGIDTSSGFGLSINAGLDPIAGVSLELGTVDGIAFGSSIGGGLLDVGFELGTFELADLDLSVGGFADVELLIDSDSGIAAELAAGLGAIAELKLAFDVPDGISIGINADPIASVDLAISSGLVGDLPGVVAEVSHALEATTDMPLDIGHLLAAGLLSATPDSEIANITEALSDAGIVPDLGTVLSEFSSSEFAGELPGTATELAPAEFVEALLVQSVPSLMNTSDELLVSIMNDSPSILGLELPLGYFDTEADSGAPVQSSLHTLSATSDSAFGEDFNSLADVLPLPVNSTIVLADSTTSISSTPLELVSNGVYTDFGIALQADAAFDDVQALGTSGSSVGDGLLSSVDRLLSLDDDDVVATLDSPTFLAGLSTDDGSIKGLGSLLL